MPDVVKIGMTSSGVPERMRSLDTSSVPLAFECYYAARVEDMARVEAALHTAFGDKRVRASREFFRVDPYRAKAVLELLAIEDVTPREEVETEPGDAAAIQQARRMRPKFEFSMADVPMGAELTFARGDGLTATVIDNRNIEFRGETFSLSGAARQILQSLGYRGSDFQGTAYWLYEGQTLDERRREIEGVGAYGEKE
jgi:hypothetical protein